MAIRVGVDIGGTFTDFVVHDRASGKLSHFKRLSTPRAPAEAVLEGLASLELAPDAVLVHGSTVGTNAVLERTGARTAFVTTRGFRDLLTIGRQNREALYDLLADRPDPLVPRPACFEVGERVDAGGEVLVPLEQAELRPLLESIQRAGYESVAICLLFSFLRPDHERLLARALRQAGVPTTASSELVPEFREFERASTTVLNAYVMPAMDRYLAGLAGGLPRGRLWLMQSNGGHLSARQARAQPVRAMLSGPAGGVVGAAAAADSAGFRRVVAFDMGGTSTDVSLAIGGPRLTSEGSIAGLPIRLPMIDIHTIGSGGGSIARVDPGGSLKVGPRSAGADPGPACYGRGGEEPTVSDANLVLGRLLPDRFLGGSLRLDPDAAWRAIDRLGAELGLPVGPTRAAQAAWGVLQVVNAQMARAIRLVSVERGQDPRDCALVSYGGAGGLHAGDVARGVAIPRVVVPAMAATLSAYGMLIARPSVDRVLTVMLPGDTDPLDLEGRLKGLEAEATARLVAEGLLPERIEVLRQLDLRYRGQSYELTVTWQADFSAAFHRLHEQTYGYSDPSRPIEIVSLRVRSTGGLDEVRVAPEPPGDPDPAGAYLDQRPVVLQPEQAPAEIACYDGEALTSGARLEGPALVSYPDTTVLLHPSDRATLDGHRNLIVEIGA